MKNILNSIGKIFVHLSKRQLGVQGTFFLILAIMSLFIHNTDRFWLFMISSIAFTGMQTIVDELKSLKK